MVQDNSTGVLTGKPTILVVDDDEVMREVCSLMVTDAGGEVLTAVDGADAVEVFAEERDRIACVVLDYSMPRLNGYEVFMELQRMDPEVKVVMVSGLARTPEVEELCRSGEIDFLSKPFRSEQLIPLLARLTRVKL